MGKNSRGRNGRSQPAKTTADQGKPLNSNANQPHNANKEALGPNTDR